MRFFFQRKSFIKTAKVFPLASYFKFKVDPHVYRKVVGCTEILCGLILALIPGRHISTYKATMPIDLYISEVDLFWLY